MRIFVFLFFSFLFSWVSVKVFSNKETGTLKPVGKGFSTGEIHDACRPDSIHWVTMKDLETRWKGRGPMNVAVDVDDTLLLNSAAKHKTLRDMGKNWRKDLAGFYQKMNCEYVEFSLPKQIGREILAFHRKRGDTVYVLTARHDTPCLKTAPMTLDKYLREVFDYPAMPPVIYTNTGLTGGSKTRALADHKIAVYYGDADSDILEARQAGAEGIRVMRATNSLRSDKNHIGMYGEPVLAGSDR